jgi:hypothetical protein
VVVVMKRAMRMRALAMCEEVYAWSWWAKKNKCGEPPLWRPAPPSVG